MDKVEKLKDGTNVIIRLLRLDDLDKLMKFYRGLPIEDRKYLKFDVLNRKVVAKRLKRIETGDDVRIIALLNNEVIASGALELSGEQWSKHQGEIRVIIAHGFQHKGLGTIMIRELYFIAVQKKVELIIARMMRPQAGAQHVFRRLGFRKRGDDDARLRQRHRRRDAGPDRHGLQCERSLERTGPFIQRVGLAALPRLRAHRPVSGSARVGAPFDKSHELFVC